MIILQNINKTFQDGTPNAFIALKEINLEIKKGECIILSGISGSGKSTLLSLLAALDRPSSGKIEVDGELVSKLPDLHASAYRAGKIGMVFQHFNLLEQLSVEENVIVPLIHSGKSLKTIKQMAKKAMTLAFIDHKAAQNVASLSGGEKQRCAIARALVNNPALILCDEPTANLDKDNSLKFIQMMQGLYEAGKTIVIATHDPLFERLPFDSRVVRMEDGAIGE